MYVSNMQNYSFQTLHKFPANAENLKPLTQDENIRRMKEVSGDFDV